MISVRRFSSSSTRCSSGSGVQSFQGLRCTVPWLSELPAVLVISKRAKSKTSESSQSFAKFASSSTMMVTTCDSLFLNCSAASSYTLSSWFMACSSPPILLFFCTWFMKRGERKSRKPWRSMPSAFRKSVNAARSLGSILSKASDTSLPPAVSKVRQRHASRTRARETMSEASKGRPWGPARSARKRL